MNKEELKQRTKQFALRTMKLIRSLPRDVSGKVLANQLMRSATSVGANYRSACRGRSKAEWRAEVGVCLEEVDESAYWLELIMEGEILPSQRVEPLWKEADEICAIFYSALESAKRPS